MEKTNIEYKKKYIDLQAKYDILRKIATQKGFFDYYFLTLKNYKTGLDCFNAINELHLEVLGELRYSDWSSFAKMKNYYFKKNQKK